LGYPQIDGIASVAIGLLLAGSSVFLARESKSLLMGEPAYPFIRKSILSIANSLDHAAFPVPATSNAACGFPGRRQQSSPT
jgi:divalent metal cation (Fe/Co/Zn/Cd) transporter